MKIKRSIIRKSRFIDLSGRKLGFVTVMKFSHFNKAKQAHFKCKCDCGNIFITQSHCLISGNTKSCGCYRKRISSEVNRKNVIGKKYGQLLVLGFHSKKGKHLRYKCICDCKNKTVVYASNLISGHTKSCGCLFSKNRKTHGLSRTRTYDIWIAMKQRCTNPRTKFFSRYGGRGITVCKKWMRSFEAFYDHIGEIRYPLTIDRIDNDKGYYPGNVRLVTRAIQSNNISRNIIITFNNKKMTLMQSSIKSGISYAVLRYRFKKYGDNPSKLFQKTKSSHTPTS